MNEKTFDFHGTEYTVSRCTAIADVDDYKEECRQNALLVSSTTDGGERINYVVFGYEMPEDDEEFAAMSEDAMMWDSDWETLETVRMIG